MNNTPSKYCSQCGGTLNSNENFCSKCGTSTSIPNNSKTSMISDKSGVITLILCIFLGNFGIHRFYVGKIGTGILMLLTFGCFGIWTLVDMVMIACCYFEDSEGRQICFIRSPQSLSPIKVIFLTLGIFFATLFLFVGISIGSVYYMTQGLVETVQNQLIALKSSEFEKAYSYNSDAFKKAVSIEDFKKFVEKSTAFTKNKDTSFDQREVENDQGHLKGRLESIDGTATTIEYRLVKEDGVWKILFIKTNSGEIGKYSKSKSSSGEIDKDSGNKSNSGEISQNSENK